MLLPWISYPWASGPEPNPEPNTAYTFLESGQASGVYVQAGATPTRDYFFSHQDSIQSSIYEMTVER